MRSKPSLLCHALPLLVACQLFSFEPLVEKAVIPKIPSIYRLIKSSGAMTVEISVNSQGKPTQIKVIKPMTSIERDQRFASSAFASWQFVSGKPGSYILLVKFQLLPPSASESDLETEFEPKGILTIRGLLPQPEIDPVIQSKRRASK